MAETVCDCIKTTIDNPFRPGNFFFDFKKTIVSGTGYLDIDFSKILEAGFQIEGVEDKSDTKSTSILQDATNPTIIIRYTFNTTSTYWDDDFREDVFELKLKNSFSGEISVVLITIRSLPVDGEFAPSDIAINVQFPYPDSLRVNLNQAWSNPSSPPTYLFYKSGYFNENLISDAKASPYDDHEIWIDIKELASQSTTTSVPFYLANVSEGPVDEERDVIGFANINLTFQS